MHAGFGFAVRRDKTRKEEAVGGWWMRGLRGLLPSAVWPVEVLDSPLLVRVMPRGVRGWLGSWELLLPFVVPVVYGLVLFLPGWDIYERSMVVVLGILLLPYFLGFFVSLAAAMHVRMALMRIDVEQLVMTRLRHGEIVRAVTLAPAMASRSAIMLYFIILLAEAMGQLYRNPTAEVFVTIGVCAVVGYGMFLLTRVTGDNLVMLAAYHQVTERDIVPAYLRSLFPGGLMFLLGVAVPAAAVAMNSEAFTAFGAVLLFFFLFAYSGNTPPALMILKDLDGHPEQWWVHGEG